jgi:hypothetical protein
MMNIEITFMCLPSVLKVELLEGMIVSNIFKIYTWNSAWLMLSTQEIFTE